MPLSLEKVSKALKRIRAARLTSAVGLIFQQTQPFSELVIEKDLGPRAPHRQNVDYAKGLVLHAVIRHEETECSRYRANHRSMVPAFLAAP